MCCAILAGRASIDREVRGHGFEQAGLIRSGGLWFELTPFGRVMLEPGRRGTLQALLFRHAFWDMDLSRLVHAHPSDAMLSRTVRP